MAGREGLPKTRRQEWGRAMAQMTALRAHRRGGPEVLAVEQARYHVQFPPVRGFFRMNSPGAPGKTSKF